MSPATSYFGGLVLGGILLAIGWGVQAARGAGGGAGVIGGLAIAIGPIVSLMFEMEARRLHLANHDFGLGIFVVLGLTIGLIAHTAVLDHFDFDGTRLLAFIALIGVGGEALANSMHWPLPGFLWLALGWCGTLGGIAFGVALAVAAGQRSRGS